MKNKRLIILLSIFAFLIVVVILCSTLFTVRSSSVSVEWHSSPLVQLQDKTQNIIEEVPVKENIMLINKEEIIEILEQNFPYIEVLKIEKKFPNKLVVHAVERQDQYALLLDGEYYALDREGKVVNIYTEVQYNNLDTNRKPILVNVKGYTIDKSTIQLGKIADISKVLTLLQNMSQAFKLSGFTESWQVINNFEKISIEFGYVSKLILINNRNITVDIAEINENLSEKIQFAVGLLRSEEFKDKTNVTLTIRYNPNGELVGGVGQN